MKYQTDKDLVESQRYLKVLGDFCKAGVVEQPALSDHSLPWEPKEDPLEDYLLYLLQDEKYGKQVVNSKLRGKVFYDSVGKFIVECVHHARFQRQRAWTERHRAEAVMDWSVLKRMATDVWLPLVQELSKEHKEDGFDRDFFLELFSEDGATKDENWERLVRDWKRCIEHQVTRKLTDFIRMRSADFETGLRRTMEQVTRHIKTQGITEQRAIQAWELMSGGWTETEFERKLNEMKIQDRYPEIQEIVAKMGRLADANGKDRLTIASGISMKMEHSSGSDIEGITVGDDLNSLLPLELAQYCDEDMEGLFIYKYRTRRLQTFRYKSEMAKPSRKLGFTHASRKGPMIVCLDTSASMYGTPERISATLISLLEQTAEDLERDCFLIDFSVNIHAIDLMERHREKRLAKLGIASLASEANASSASSHGNKPSLPFIGGGTSAKKMMAVMFDLLENDGLRYVNADVLWVTDFMIPEPPQTLLRRFAEFKETGTRFYGIRIVRTNDQDTNQWERYFNKIYTIRYRPVRRY